ncbi:MAG: glutamate formimidoyltransferase [Bacteroidales bacterium]|jgi:glutamate formiminotransferase/formiminotetrahydrofolate cyclodeaminase|nr:glutamate formimidoyltransferase [Bacteroidales bacterium]MDD3100502.1 glutamate formimidoyltransferase [Bacteroidales bacterium]MDD3639388.1 glutamate formimidoyltransferase [Bacteroidales bacterium]MDD3944029.1 glutamate formimidoyltransferase [Bacteroidales bacterium]MDD4480219.1 glutamate formimidoyltransferase [Bacteroidales bacterium]
MKKIIECVPNFSEGRDRQVIDRIAGVISGVEGVKLLNVDPGKATHRTVMTFAGSPEAVLEAAFRAIRTAAECIDMRKHHGEHPRIGATDVCPLIPVSGVTMEETVEYARQLARRVGEELHIPVYCYEHAAFTENRRNLAVCRSGEYEGLETKLKDTRWKPDFGPVDYNERTASTGLTVIGARDFLIAVNFNLNTTSVRRANAISFDVREKGRKIVVDGIETVQPGTLRHCKAIGWFIKEYGMAQVSMNLTNLGVTPLHIAFDEVCEKALQRGIRVTGTELVGLVPKSTLVDAGRHFLRKQQRSLGLPEEEIIRMAVRSMGLDELKPFDPKTRILEYLLEDPAGEKSLCDLTCRGFALETASESPAPGGGSVSAYMGALGASLGTMVANLSSHKRGWDEQWEYFSQWAEKGQDLISRLLHLVDEDTLSYNRVMEAFSMPRETLRDKEIRADAIEKATLYASRVPLETMKTALEVFDILEAMTDKGNPNSVTDAGVGAPAVLGAVKGGYLNVLINIGGLCDKEMARSLREEAEKLLAQAKERENRLWEHVKAKINQ